MSLLSRLRNALRFKPDPQRVYIPYRQAGVTVTEDTALAFSAVHAAVRIIAETLAALPWQVFARLASGRESLPNHPVQWFLNVQANPEMSAYVFRRLMVQHMLLWGNGLAEIERDNAGRVRNLWPLPPDRVTLERSPDGELLYRVRIDGNAEALLPRASVLHISDGSYNGLWGASRIQLARRSVGAGIAADAFAASFYGNGATIGGVIINKGRKLSAEARDFLLGEFNAKYAGPERAHKTMYLDDGHEYSPGTMPLQDQQFLETRRFQVEEICRWFGVPPHLVQELSEANYAISYEASKNFVEHTLRPLCVLMEQEANVRLFGYRAQGITYSRINLAGLLRADPKTRGEYYRSLINAGVMSINETRELEELNSIGPDGDQHYMQSNMTTLARIAAWGGQPLPEESAEEEEQEDDEEDADTTPPAVPENVIRRDARAWWNAGGREWVEQQEQAHG